MNKRNRPRISHEKLLYHVAYDKDSGVFSWKVPTSWKFRAGDVLGHDPACAGGRRSMTIGLSNERYKVGQLAWFYVTGSWPKALVDHKDGDHTNNRWNNLREASNSLNMENQRRARADNISGLLGVSVDPRREGLWQARIMVQGRSKSLGYHSSPEAAHQAYLAAKRSLHTGCTI